jgi:ABC-type glycerol-3-phosphate transport system substrate-binding protein
MKGFAMKKRVLLAAALVAAAVIGGCARQAPAGAFDDVAKTGGTAPASDPIDYHGFPYNIRGG